MSNTNQIPYKILQKLNETDKAYQLQLQNKAGNVKESWLPKSKIIVDDDFKFVMVPLWLSNQIMGITAPKKSEQSSTPKIMKSIDAPDVMGEILALLKSIDKSLKKLSGTDMEEFLDEQMGAIKEEVIDEDEFL
jgi:hypothetical protein